MPSLQKKIAVRLTRAGVCEKGIGHVYVLVRCRRHSAWLAYLGELSPAKRMSHVGDIDASVVGCQYHCEAALRRAERGCVMSRRRNDLFLHGAVRSQAHLHSIAR